MGTGKSAVGQRLASLTGREFVDTDAEIVRTHGPISDIFSSDGEARFRTLEREVVARLAPKRNLVIATGGGTMLDQDNVLSLLGSEIFTLTAQPDEIVRRATTDGLDSRPLLANSDDPVATVRALLSERAESYGRFPSVPTDDRSIDEVIDELRTAGASIPSPEDIEGQPATRSSTDTAVTLVIALVLAVLIVLVVLVLTF